MPEAGPRTEGRAPVSEGRPNIPDGNAAVGRKAPTTHHVRNIAQHAVRRGASSSSRSSPSRRRAPGREGARRALRASRRQFSITRRMPLGAAGSNTAGAPSRPKRCSQRGRDGHFAGKRRRPHQEGQRLHRIRDGRPGPVSCKSRTTAPVCARATGHIATTAGAAPRLH